MFFFIIINYIYNTHILKYFLINVLIFFNQNDDSRTENSHIQASALNLVFFYRFNRKIGVVTCMLAIIL